MLRKTHIAIGLAAGLYFLPLVKNKMLFIPLVLAATLLPDIDSINSNIGRKRIFMPIQLFLKHRGPLHSYTICILISLALAFFYPVFSLPFFLGYSFHLLADSFTINGIKPFWPLKHVSNGKVTTGGLIDKALFGIFGVVDAVLLLFLFV